MPVLFNIPGTQTVYAPGGGRGSGFDGIVATFADLPTAVPPNLNALYLVTTSTGIWPINRHSAGIYQRIAITGVQTADWMWVGDIPFAFSDSQFEVYNSGSPSTKVIQFSAANLTAPRTYTFPDASVALGAVTSVALTAPAIFSVTGSPITGSGTLALALATQAANLVWAGPTTGAAAAPTFRALVAADLPAGTTPVGANPTANIGFTATNGSAATFMRSDAAPALPQAIILSRIFCHC